MGELFFPFLKGRLPRKLPRKLLRKLGRKAEKKSGREFSAYSRFAGGDRHPLTSSLASEVGSIIRCEGTADCLLGFLKQLIQGFKALALEHCAQLRV